MRNQTGGFHLVF